MSDKMITPKEILDTMTVSKGRVVWDLSKLIPRSVHTFILPPEIQDPEVMDLLVAAYNETGFITGRDLSQALGQPVWGFCLDLLTGDYVTCSCFGYTKYAYYGEMTEPRELVKAYFSPERLPKPDHLDTSFPISFITANLASVPIPDTDFELILDLFTESEIEDSGCLDILGYLETHGVSKDSVRAMTEVSEEPPENPIAILFNRELGSLGFVSQGKFYSVPIAEYMVYADLVDALYNEILQPKSQEGS